MAGTGTGGGGQAPGPGLGSGSGICNPRKFSEKIALHTQRQAEDTAAFEEVMMDITSTRFKAQRIRQAKGQAPYYGGSLPNVSQIARGFTESQSQFPCNQDYCCPIRNYPMARRESRLSPPGRPNKRHIDHAPYHTTLQSPPPGPSWRRNWSNSSAAETSHFVHLPVTALNRTNSDSALHTTLRNTQTGDSQRSTQPLACCSRPSGTPAFLFPVPLIEENVPEEGKPLKLTNAPKFLTTSTGCETPDIHIFPSSDQETSSLLNVPSSLNTCGSLPDLSSLHLPSPLPPGLDSESLNPTVPLSSANSIGHLPNTPAHPYVRADSEGPLPSLSSPLQTCISTPLLQSSLSSPNIQSSLSTNSLLSSLSSTSSCLSLSNSSLQSSLSNQSLQSTLSNSSLGNQSVQSAASHCSYSSGIGDSRSCSSSSLSGSPHAAGQAQILHTISSRKRNQVSPLIMPSSGESRWHLPKQFSPTVSPTLSSITQGVLLNTSKVSRELKLPVYHQCEPSQACPPLTHQLSLQLQQFKPEGQREYLQETKHHVPSQHQVHHHKNTQGQNPQQLHLRQQHQLPHSHAQQYQAQHQYPQTQHQQQFQKPQDPQPQPTPQQEHLPLQAPPHLPQQQEYQHKEQQQQQQQHIDPQPYSQVQQLHQQEHLRLQCQPHLWYQQYPPHSHQPSHHRQDQEQDPGYQSHQCQSQGARMPTQSQATFFQNAALSGILPSTPEGPVQTTLRPCKHAWEQLKQLSKVKVLEGRGKSILPGHKAMSSARDSIRQGGIPGLQDSGSQLSNESYMGLQLTPSQTEALSQQLGQIHRETSGVSGATGPTSRVTMGKNEPDFESLHPHQTQSHCDGTYSFSGVTLADPASWLDQEISGFPGALLDLDMEPFALDDSGCGTHADGNTLDADTLGEMCSNPHH
ncbi:CREB-regulated transcription coactivator 2 [Chanos chanos]|uniref:CREB-regulated transcription coactivator 2 n=1 Tax=Chanos chanos TaxID=29144 RepID=A0A6J2WL15_CHACN|nr:CREB-regulated transcription coactivator 2-like [Chanos chanos]